MGGRVERDCVVSFLDYYTMGPKRFSKSQFIPTFWFHKIFSHVVVTLLKEDKNLWNRRWLKVWNATSTRPWPHCGITFRIHNKATQFLKSHFFLNILSQLLFYQRQKNLWNNSFRNSITTSKRPWPHCGIVIFC